MFACSLSGAQGLDNGGKPWFRFVLIRDLSDIADPSLIEKRISYVPARRHDGVSVLQDWKLDAVRTLH